MQGSTVFAQNMHVSQIQNVHLVFSMEFRILCSLLQVVSILESRARSVDITTQNYYDLLYAFYVSRVNFGKGVYNIVFNGIS